MSSLRILISPQQLYPVNDLTRSSGAPGDLNYHTYRQYLTTIGHVKIQNTTGRGLMSDRQPQNTTLQPVTGDRQDNNTDFRADQAFWSIDSLPDIIYEFEKPVGWLEKSALKDPPLKTYNIYGQRLRDIPILPDHISSKVEGWRVEAWTRFDARVGLQDIMARMAPNQRPTNKSGFQMRSFRFRNDCKLLGWVVPGKSYDQRKAQLQLDLASANVNTGPGMNTTRGLSWGLVNPSQGESGGRVAVPNGNRTQDTVETVGPQMLQPLPSAAVAQPQQPPAAPVTALPSLQSGTEDVSAVASPSTQASRGTYSVVDDADEEELDSFDSRSSVDAQTPLGPRKPSKTMFVDDEDSDDEEVDTVTASDPASSQDTAAEVVTVTYDGEPLSLIPPTQRVEEGRKIALLTSKFYPYGSEGRREQLAYILNPERLRNGFVDNRGHSAPVGYQGCTEHDIIYRD